MEKLKLLKKLNKKRLIISATVLIILGILIYNIPAIYEFFVYSDYQTVEGLIGGDYMMERYGSDMLCYNNKEMSRVSSSGDVEWTVAVSTTSPKAIVKNDYILLADLSGNNAYLYNDDKLRCEIKISEEICVAALDRDGNVALASKKRGYKGAVAIFNDDGEKQYEFSSGEGYISALDILDDELVMSQVTATETGVNSRIILVNWKDNEEKQCENKKDSLVFDVKFQPGGDIIAVSDKDLTGYDDDGTLDFEVDFKGRNLKKYNVESEDNLVFCFEGDRNNSVIESYSKSGDLRGTRTENGEISGIDVCGEAILINNMRSVKKIYPNGDAEEAIISKHDVRGIKLFSSRRQAFITGNSQATVVKVKN